MPDIFDTISEAPAPSRSDIFDRIDYTPDVFDIIAPDEEAGRKALGLNGFPVARDPMERAAQDFQIEQGAKEKLAAMPPGPPALEEGPSGPPAWYRDFRHSKAMEDLFGPEVPVQDNGAANEIKRKGLVPTLAAIPARIASDTGRGVKAALGDIAAGLKGDKSEEGNFGGNLKSLLERDDTLPIERALQLSKEQDKQDHTLGWQTISADIALGLADLAPKVAMLEAAPGGMLMKSGAAADIFGFNEKGEFNSRNAAFAAAFPFVTKAASSATDSAIQKAVDRGFEWAGKPGAQRALHVAANQAAMDAIITAQSAPELMKLAQSDPQEFKRELAKIIGSNLAFGIPEAMKQHGTIEKSPEPGPPVAATPDLAAELKAAMEKNQVVKPAEAPAGNLPLKKAESAESQTEGRLARSDEPYQEIPGRDLVAELLAENKRVAELERQLEEEHKAQAAQAAIDRTGEAARSSSREIDPQDTAGATSAQAAADTALENSDRELSGREPTGEPGRRDSGGDREALQTQPEPEPAQSSGELPEFAPSTVSEPVVEANPGSSRHGGTAAAPEPAKAGTPNEESDPVIKWLDKAIAAVDPLGPAKRGELSDGLAGLPLWMARTTADAAFRVVREAYQNGKKLYHAIEEGVKWMAAQNIPNFNEAEARDYLALAAREAKVVVQRMPKGSEYLPTEEEFSPESKAQSPKPDGGNGSQRSASPTTGPTLPPEGLRDWRTVMAERDQASEDMHASLKKNDPKQRGGLSKDEVRQEQAMATARYRTLRDELHSHPDYVADLLERNEKAVNELKAAGENSTRDQRAEVENLKADLEAINPKLLNATYDRLQKEGRLFKAPPGPPLGRSLDKVSDWLKEAGALSPKRSLRERLALGQKAMDRWNGIRDAFNSARVKLAVASKTALESYLHPPTDTPFRNIIKDWIFADQYTGLQTRRWVQTINDAVENPVRQMAISVWLDAGGDAGLLRYQADTVPERYRRIYQTALELTPGEKELGLRVKADFAAKLEDAILGGLVKKGRADYGVPQRWKKGHAPEPDPAAVAEGRKGGPGNPGAKLDPRDPFFAFERSHDSYFDGIMDGGVPESLKLSDLVAGYNEAFHKALSSRGAIWGLKNELAADGLPIIKITGSAQRVSENDPGAYFVDSKAHNASDVSKAGLPYQSVNHFAMRDWKVASVAEDGKKIIVRGDMQVHPDHSEWLKNELESSLLKERRPDNSLRYARLNRVMDSSAYLKASKMSLAGFHLMTIGEHMASHLVNPFTNGFEIDLRDPKQALLVRNGLELGMGAHRVAFEEGLSSHGGLFRQVPGLGDLSAKLTDWMFKEYIPTIMMKTGLHAFEANKKRYSEKLSENQIAELTAHQMNAAGGLQNYRLLGRNKNLLDLNRMVLLAPQFLESRAKVVGQALKPYGAEQRKMLIVQAGVLYAGCRVLNQLLDDDMHWESDAAFGVVFRGRMYSIRTIVGDFWHLVKDQSSFAAGRLSPLKIIWETVTQRDMRTGARKEPPIQTDWMPGRIAQNLVVDVLSWLPFIGSEGFLPGAAGREQTILSSALTSVGIGSRKYTHQTQVSGWARDFNRQSSDPAARTWQRHMDGQAHGEGAYRKLDALLDAGDLKRAAIEYDALQKDGHKEASIEQRYSRVERPFTGSGEREETFRASLSASQKQIYDRAIAERVKRQETFEKMISSRTARTE